MKFYYLSQYMQDCTKFVGEYPCSQQKIGVKCLSCDKYIKRKRALLCCFGACGECLVITAQIKALKNLGYIVDVATTEKMSSIFKAFNNDFVNLIISGNDWVKASCRRYDLVLSVEKNKEACSLLNYYLKMKNIPRYAFFGYNNGEYIIYTSNNDVCELMLHEFNIGQDDKQFRKSSSRAARIKKIYKGLNIDLSKCDLGVGVSPLSKKKGRYIGIMCFAGAAFGGSASRVPKLNKFVKLFSKINSPTKIFLLGGSADNENNKLLKRELKKKCGWHEVVDTTDNKQSSCKNSFELINELEIIITPDTFVRHIARACDKKIFTFMSSTKTNDFVAIKNETLLKNLGDSACQCFGSAEHVCWSNDNWINEILKYMGVQK